MSLDFVTSRPARWKARFAVTPLFIFGLSCSEDEPSAPAPPISELVVVSGDLQTGTVGQGLADPLVAQLRHRETGEGLANRPISLTVESGMGSVAGTAGGSAAGDGATLTTQTDASGRVSVALGLGPEAGLQIFSVHTSVEVTGDSLVRIFAVAEPGAVQRVVKSGDGQEGATGAVLPLPVAVLLSDRFGNPVSGVEVGFGATAGGGSVSESMVATDEFGSAAVEWTLGAAAGSQAMSAVVDGVGTFRFEAIAQ